MQPTSSSLAIPDCLVSTMLPQEVPCMNDNHFFKFSWCVKCHQSWLAACYLGMWWWCVSIPPPQDDYKTAVNTCDTCRWLKNGLHVSASTLTPLSRPWEHAWASLLEGETHGAETSCPITPVSTSVNRELAPDVWASSAKSAGLPSQPTANCRCMSEARQDRPNPAEINWTLNFEPNMCLLLCTTEVLWLFCSTVVEIMDNSSVGNSRLTMG